MTPVDNSAGPVFVVGYSRSGTKFVCNLLEAASGGRVVSLGELHFLGRLATTGRERLENGDIDDIRNALADQYLRKKGCPYSDRAAVLAAVERFAVRSPLGTRLDVFRHFLAAVAADLGASIACDGTPRNAYYIGELLAEFENARVIYMLRDPRDAILSQKRKSAQVSARGDDREAARLAANYNPLLMARFWDRSAQNCDRFSGDPRVVQLRYEDLLAEPTRVLRDLGQLLNVAGLEEHATKVQRDNSGKWKAALTAGEVAAIEFTARKGMRLRGYSTTTRTVRGLASSLWWALRLLVQSPRIYIENAGRFAKFGHEFKKRILGTR